MKHRMRLSLFLVIVLLTACSPAEQTPPPSGTVLWMDDFSDHSSGWMQLDNDNTIIAYHEGGLRMVISSTATQAYSTSAKSFVDSWLEVQVSTQSGALDGQYGLICRFQDALNYYTFVTGPDGYSGIIRVQDGLPVILTGGKLQFQSAVHLGEKTNHLRADCTGNRLTFYINSEKIAEVTDEAYKEGEAGLWAASMNEAPVNFWFDNFIAYQP